MFVVLFLYVPVVVDLDLLAEQFTPGKKHYDSVLLRFANAPYLKFNLLLAWEPTDEQICPSSIAAYLQARNFCVTLCRPRFQERHDINVTVPLLGSEDVGKSCSSAELLEWLGAYSIGVDLQSSCPDEYLSSYQCPTENQLCDTLVNLQWTGFFTTSKIKKLFNEIRHFIALQQKSPWASIHVQGFSDSPINWGLQEHHFYINGDNNYTIFIRPDDLYLICSVISSNKRPRSKKGCTK